MVTSPSAGVVFLVRDSQLHIGDFTHFPEGRAIVLEVTYHGTPIQVVNVYMLAKRMAKEYRPQLQWLRPCRSGFATGSFGGRFSV